MDRRNEKPSEVPSERKHSWTVPFVNCLHRACSGAGCLPPLVALCPQPLLSQTSSGAQPTDLPGPQTDTLALAFLTCTLGLILGELCDMDLLTMPVSANQIRCFALGC